MKQKFLKKAMKVINLQTDYEGKEMQKNSEMFIMIELESLQILKK